MQHEHENHDSVGSRRALHFAPDDTATGLISSLTIAMGISAGAWLIWAGAVNIVATTIGTFSHQDYVGRSFMLSATGEPELEVRQTVNGVSSEYRTDLNGDRLPENDPNDEGRPVTTNMRVHFYGRQRNARPVDLVVIAFEQLPSSGRVNEVWYLVHARDSSDDCWLECWSAADNRRKYCLGLSGKTSEPPLPSERFQIPKKRRNFSAGWAHFDGTGSLQYRGDGSSEAATLYMATTGSVLRINLVDLSVQPLAQTPPGLISVSTATPYLTGPKSLRATQTDKRRLFFRTRDQLIEMNLNGQVTRTLPLADIPQSARLTFSETVIEDQGIRRHLWWETEARTDTGRSVQIQLCEVSDNNELSDPQTIQWREHYPGLTLSEVRTAIGLGLPAPLLLTGAEAFKRFILRGKYYTSRIAAVICGLLTVLSLWLFWRHSGTLPVAPGKVWILYILLFGLPGYLGYRCHRRWSALRPSVATDDTVRDLPTIIAA